MSSSVFLLLLFVTISCLVSTNYGFLLGDTCLNRCDKGKDSHFNCQCNSHCTKYNDCCSDYQLRCVTGTNHQGSCQGRCNGNYDKNLACQCNSQCTSHHNCCNDYQSLCVVSTATTTAAHGCYSFSQMGPALWNSDVNRLSQSDFSLDYQTQISDGTSDDKASQKLFSHVEESKLSGPTYTAFLTLLDNFNPSKGGAESVTAQEIIEVNTFLDAILNTKVMDELLQFLKCQGTVTSKSGLKSLLDKLWFQQYPRSSNGHTLDTSGFEHVLVGEYRDSSTVNGFHSWLSFYTKEKAGDINYLGYVKRRDPYLIGPAFKWNRHLKTLGSFFVGVSPEFDIAVYTLCYLQHKNDWCSLTLNGHQLRIKTYDTNGHLATAYISI